MPTVANLIAARCAARTGRGRLTMVGLAGVPNAALGPSHFHAIVTKFRTVTQHLFQ
jgi:hypothetical protein